MSLISADDQAFLREHFAEKLVNDVTLRFYTQRQSILAIPGQECGTCKDTHQILDEVVGLSDKLHLEVQDFVADQAQATAAGITEIPAIVLEGQNKGALRFIGVPSGYEFSTLIEDLVDVSRGTTELEPHTREIVAGLTSPVHLQVFVTPT